MYTLHGYSEVATEHQLNAVTIKSDTRNIYHCHLPYSGCDYDISCIMDALDKQIDKHSKGERVDIVGLSFSGMISQLYAADHPDKVDKLALVFSFSKIHDPYMLLRMITKNPEYTKEIMKYDLSKLQQPIHKPTIAINCYWDRYIIGDPPEVDGKSYDIKDCLHHHYFVPERTREKIKEFLEEPSVDL